MQRSKRVLLLAGGIPSLLALAWLPQTLWSQGATVSPRAPGAPAGLQGADGRQPISSLPFTIDECGSYFLTGCLTGQSGSHGITIDADDVTLDLNGFTLSGVPGSLNGIHVQGARSNLRVVGGGVRDWDGMGADAFGASESQFHCLRFFGNGLDGLGVGQGCIVRDCVAGSNGQDGIVVGFGSSILDCTAQGNGRNGIHAVPAATVTGCTIDSCAARANGADGIVAGDGTVLVDCSATLNAGNGIAAAAGCVVSDCTATLNNMDGIVTFGSLVRGNAAVANGGASINAPGSTVLENHP